MTTSPPASLIRTIVERLMVRDDDFPGTNEIWAERLVEVFTDAGYVRLAADEVIITRTELIRAADIIAQLCLIADGQYRTSYERGVGNDLRAKAGEAV